jgi:TorA maturation chaperone TorD
MAAVEAQGDVDVAPEDLLRANVYRLLAHLLRAPADAAALRLAAALTGDDTPLGGAVAALARIAGKVTPEAVGREYHDLFIGLGRGELVPYGSYYLTGFLHEKPLERLRSDMARLGIARMENASEPEDHVAALCEMMAGLITGRFGPPVELGEQKRFFAAHLAPWAKHFFGDLEAAKASVLYAAVGNLGKAFLEIETTAFEMVRSE